MGWILESQRSQEPDAGSGPISVVIVEDHVAVAESLTAALARVADITVLDTAPDLQSGLSVIGARQPDVVIIDATLPDGDGASAAPAIKERSPGTAVVVLSGSQYPSVAIRAVHSGAVGYVSKIEPLQRVVAAVRTAASGGTAFTSDVLRSAVTRSTDAGGQILTERELEVLQHVADGRSTEEVAEAMSLSVHTIRNHIRNITKKFDVNSRLAAVAVAHERGLVTPPGSS